MSANVSVNDSTIGPVSAYLLNVVVKFVLVQYVMPELNEVGARGIPLPRINFVQFVNAGLELQKDVIRVSADIKYIGENDEDISTMYRPMSSMIFKSIGDYANDLEQNERLKYLWVG